MENNRWKNLSGYVNVLYEAKISVLVLYKKLTEPPSIGSNKNRIYQIHRVYLLKGNQPFQVKNKREILLLLKDRKEELKNFIREKKFRLSVKSPDSIIPLAGYYDSL